MRVAWRGILSNWRWTQGSKWRLIWAIYSSSISSPRANVNTYALLRVTALTRMRLPLGEMAMSAGRSTPLRRQRGSIYKKKIKVLCEFNTLWRGSLMIRLLCRTCSKTHDAIIKPIKRNLPRNRRSTWAGHWRPLQRSCLFSTRKRAHCPCRQ